MRTDTQATTRAARPVTPAGTARLRRSSLAVLVLIVAEYLIGMYVSLYVTVPKADHGAGLGRAISAGPAVLSIHAVVGLLLAIGALGVLAQAIRRRRWGVTALAAAGTLALAFASVAGASFTSTGDTADSMAMAVMTGIALLCYAVTASARASSSAGRGSWPGRRPADRVDHGPASGPDDSGLGDRQPGQQQVTPGPRRQQ
jgi:hypothetical protein